MNQGDAVVLIKPTLTPPTRYTCEEGKEIERRELREKRGKTVTRERQEGESEKDKSGRKQNRKTERNMGNVKHDGVRKKT